ncbi:carbohydrate esterase family 3 protein [Hypoxylon sp. FL0543]|nr:carbohydrate esterase family 3 protein [Hypoxylon sp. FL0543]
MVSTKHLVWCILACASSLADGVAVPRASKCKPASPPDNTPDNTTGNSTKAAAPADQAKGFGNGVPLRIMPLGASITHGYKSSDGNGYRQDLRVALEKNGNKVNMVGERTGGTMKDDQSEGWEGYKVAQIHVKANKVVPEYKPNLILINAGTNDCIQNDDLPNAGNRMISMLNDIYKESPRATIILSTLIVNANPKVQARVKDFNNQLKLLADRYRAGGFRLVLVDMESDAGPKLTDLNKDGTHPTDAGYKKMANIFFDGIKQADEQHFLQEAEKVDGIADEGPN